jgi:hypothetical protein
MLTIRVQPYTSNGYQQHQISLRRSKGDNTALHTEPSLLKENYCEYRNMVRKGRSGTVS